MTREDFRFEKKTDHFISPENQVSTLKVDNKVIWFNPEIQKIFPDSHIEIGKPFDGTQIVVPLELQSSSLDGKDKLLYGGESFLREVSGRHLQDSLRILGELEEGEKVPYGPRTIRHLVKKGTGLSRTLYDKITVENWRLANRSQARNDHEASVRGLLSEKEDRRARVNIEKWSKVVGKNGENGWFGVPLLTTVLLELPITTNELLKGPGEENEFGESRKKIKMAPTASLYDTLDNLHRKQFLPIDKTNEEVDFGKPVESVAGYLSGMRVGNWFRLNTAQKREQILFTIEDLKKVEGTGVADVPSYIEFLIKKFAFSLAAIHSCGNMHTQFSMDDLNITIAGEIADCGSAADYITHAGLMHDIGFVDNGHVVLRHDPQGRGLFNALARFISSIEKIFPEYAKVFEKRDTYLDSIQAYVGYGIDLYNDASDYFKDSLKGEIWFDYLSALHEAVHFDE